MRNGIVDDATGELERIDVDPATFDMSGKVLIEDVPDDLTGLRWDAATRAFVEDWTRFDAALHARIDREAGETVTPFITIRPGQTEAYAEKEAEALAWQSDPDPDPANYPACALEASLIGVSCGTIIAEVWATSQAWRPLARAIEAHRRAAKVKVSVATTRAAKEAAATVDWAAVVAGATP